MTNEREQMLRSVLGDKLEALADTADLDRYQREQAESVERARRIAKAALDASETRGILVDIIVHAGGGMRVVVCDPQGDEGAMAARVVAAMGVAHGPLVMTGEPPRRVGEPEMPR